MTVSAHLRSHWAPSFQMYTMSADVDVLIRRVVNAFPDEATALTLEWNEEGGSVLVPSGGGFVEVSWRAAVEDSVRAPAVLARLFGAVEERELRAFGVLTRALSELEGGLLPKHVEGIVRSMPLVEEFSTNTGEFEGWALVFRDHYLEHTVGCLLGLERAGIAPEDCYVLSKGDRTSNRHRIDAFFRSHGWRSGLLDNAWIDGGRMEVSDSSVAELEHVREFVADARARGRRLLLIDDGGLLALRLGGISSERRQESPFDAAMELTVSGLRRLAASAPLVIPIANVAKSKLKVRLGYREIADSCLRRLCVILGRERLAGRPVVSLGYGTLGSQLALRVRDCGAQVTVVDPDYDALLGAAQAGFSVAPSLRAALLQGVPDLILGSTGEVALTPQDIPNLPDGVVLAGFATRDFSALLSSGAVEIQHSGIGSVFRLRNGKCARRLGDGRSLNLFESDSIPNEGYDAYRAGTIIAAKALCSSIDSLRPGVDDQLVDRAVERSALYERYYDLYVEGRRVSHGASFP